MVALHPPLTLRTVADLDVEAAHDRAHHGQFFLVLRRHAGHFDRAAAVRTGRRDRRRVGLVDPRRARTAAVAAILGTGPPSGTPPATLRPALGKRCGLPATRRRASSNCRFRRSTCCFRRSFSRCRRSFLRCSLLASRSRRVNFPWSRSRSVCRSAIPCGAISGRPSSRHRYDTIPKIVQVNSLTLRPGTAIRRQDYVMHWPPPTGPVVAARSLPGDFVSEPFRPEDDVEHGAQVVTRCRVAVRRPGAGVG